MTRRTFRDVILRRVTGSDPGDKMRLGGVGRQASGGGPVRPGEFVVILLLILFPAIALWVPSLMPLGDRLVYTRGQ